MPLGRTWRQVLEDKAFPLQSVTDLACSWETCAVGERAMRLGMEEDYDNGYYPDQIIDDAAARSPEWQAYLGRHGDQVCHRSSPGTEFLRAIEQHDRKRALEILAAIETVQPGVA